MEILRESIHRAMCDLTKIKLVETKHAKVHGSESSLEGLEWQRIKTLVSLT